MSAAKQFALESLSNAELDARAAASVTSYGVGTKSYNGSAEKREMDRQRELATAKYETLGYEPYLAPLLCTCPQRPTPHELSVHVRVRYEKPGTYFVWDGKQESLVEFADSGMRWPWSLKLSVREEPSTERKAAE